MKKVLIAFLLILVAISCILKINFQNEKKETKKDVLEIGSEVNAKLNKDTELEFYIIEIKEDKFTLLLKNSLKNLKCADEQCTILNEEILDLRNIWSNAEDIRLIKNSDILSEEDLQIDSDSICTRLDSYLMPDQEGYFLENINNGKIGYVKAKDSNCVDINFENPIDKEYSLKPVIIIDKKYIIEN